MMIPFFQSFSGDLCLHISLKSEVDVVVFCHMLFVNISPEMSSTTAAILFFSLLMHCFISLIVIFSQDTSRGGIFFF